MRLTTTVTKVVRTDVQRTAPPRIRLGERLRQLRVSAGLTQTDLAGERFSKEYVSQIERGKTRPTRETVEWLATRLGVDSELPRERRLGRRARPDGDRRSRAPRR